MNQYRMGGWIGLPGQLGSSMLSPGWQTTGKGIGWIGKSRTSNGRRSDSGNWDVGGEASNIQQGQVELNHTGTGISGRPEMGLKRVG